MGNNKETKLNHTDFFLTVWFLIILKTLVSMVLGTLGYRTIKKYTNIIITHVFYDGEIDYPLDKDQIEKKNSLSHYKYLVNILQNRVTSFSKDYLPIRKNGIILKKTIDKTMGLDMTSSQGIVKVSDLVVPYSEDYLGRVYEFVDSSEQVEAVINFAKLMEKEGRNFLLFENPEKHISFYGYNDYADDKRKIINEKLKYNKINYYDCEEYMNNNYVDYKDIFFKTDHHWKPTAGLWANKLLCEYINNSFGYDIDTSIFDIKNYDVSILKEHYLGSLGRKITEVYTKKDDFEILTPKYDSDVTVFNSITSETKRGSISETLFNNDALLNKDVYKRNDYSFYSYGDIALLTSHNNMLHDGSSVLIIKLSFADVQIPFLTQVFEDVYAVDLRHFTGSLTKLIHDKNPQTIVMIYPTESFTPDAKGTLYKKSKFNFQ